MSNLKDSTDRPSLKSLRIIKQVLERYTHKKHFIISNTYYDESA